MVVTILARGTIRRVSTGRDPARSGARRGLGQTLEALAKERMTHLVDTAVGVGGAHALMGWFPLRQGRFEGGQAQFEDAMAILVARAVARLVTFGWEFTPGWSRAARKRIGTLPYGGNVRISLSTKKLDKY